MKVIVEFYIRLYIFDVFKLGATINLATTS